MQSGELIVTGSDSADFPLKTYPAEVKVHFTNELAILPCNPHHLDQLEFEVNPDPKKLNGFILTITWNVTGTREVKWHAAY